MARVLRAQVISDETLDSNARTSRFDSASVYESWTLTLKLSLALWLRLTADDSYVIYWFKAALCLASFWNSYPGPGSCWNGS